MEEQLCLILEIAGLMCMSMGWNNLIVNDSESEKKTIQNVIQHEKKSVFCVKWTMK